MSRSGGERINQDDVKAYYTTYLDRFQKLVDTDYHASASLIEFYQGLPAAVDSYMMENGSVVGLVKMGAAENRVDVYSGNFDQVKGEMRGREYDFMVPILPSHPTSVEEIDATIKYLIELRLREINFSQYMKDVVLGIVNIEGQISEISKTNPWLSKQFGELTTMLSETRKHSEDVSKLADEARERHVYEGFDEAVGFMEGYDASSAPTQLATVDVEKVRTFLTEFIRSYRATIDAKSLAKEAYPPFYSDYPYTLEFIVLPNKNVATFFTKAKEGMAFNDRQLGFNEFEGEVPNKKFEYHFGFPNCIPFDKQSAIHHAQVQAQLDLERHELTMALQDLPKSLEGIEGQIIKIKKSNPWLEQNLSGLLKTLDTCHKPIKKLMARIEKQRKAGIILRSYLNILDSSISFYPTTGDAPAAPVYEDVATAQVGVEMDQFAHVETPSEVPGAMPATDQQVMMTPSGEYEFQMPGTYEDPMAASGVGAEVPLGAPGMETGDLNEVKSMLYTFERKLADYEKRLHYIDKYTEMIQRQQNKKLKAQKELVILESRKGRWIGIGLGIAAITISVIILLASMDNLADMFGGLFG